MLLIGIKNIKELCFLFRKNVFIKFLKSSVLSSVVLGSNLCIPAIYASRSGEDLKGQDFSEQLSLEEFTERFNNMCIEFCDEYCKGKIDDFSKIKPIFDKIVRFVESYNPEFMFVGDSVPAAGWGCCYAGPWKDYFPTRLKYIHDLSRFLKDSFSQSIHERPSCDDFIAIYRA